MGFAGKYRISWSYFFIDILSVAILFILCAIFKENTFFLFFSIYKWNMNGSQVWKIPYYLFNFELEDEQPLQVRDAVLVVRNWKHSKQSDNWAARLSHIWYFVTRRRYKVTRGLPGYLSAFPTTFNRRWFSNLWNRFRIIFLLIFSWRLQGFG